MTFRGCFFFLVGSGSVFAYAFSQEKGTKNVNNQRTQCSHKCWFYVVMIYRKNTKILSKHECWYVIKTTI